MEWGQRVHTGTLPPESVARRLVNAFSLGRFLMFLISLVLVISGSQRFHIPAGNGKGPAPKRFWIIGMTGGADRPASVHGRVFQLQSVGKGWACRASNVFWGCWTHKPVQSHWGWLTFGKGARTNLPPQESDAIRHQFRR